MLVLTLAGNGTGIVTLSGPINRGSGNRDYAITKTGISTFSLTGASNYGGLTTISAVGPEYPKWNTRSARPLRERP